MNLLGGRNDVADYVHTGEWSKKSIKEAKKVRQGERRGVVGGRRLHAASPTAPTWQLTPGAAYVHICSNETIGGVEYHWTPDVGDVPLVADMSSHILSRPLDVSKYGVIYGGAQKNIGPAGLTIVIVRKDLLDRALPITPSRVPLEGAGGGRLDAQHAADLRDLHRRARVRVAARARRRCRRSSRRTSPRRSCSTTASTPDAFYTNPVRKEDRSRMNVPFKLPDRRARRGVPQGREGAGHGPAQGPPRGRRHARVDLQRDADRRRARRSSTTCASSSGATDEPRHAEVPDPHAQPDLEPRAASLSGRPLRRRQERRAPGRDPRALARHARDGDRRTA